MREFTVPYSKGLGYKSGRKECKKRHSKSPNPCNNIKIL